MKPMLPPARNVTQEVAAAMGQEASVDGFLNGLNSLKEACGVDKLKMSEIRHYTGFI